MIHNIRFIESENSIVTYFIKELNDLWNEKDFIKLDNKIEEIKLNRFINQKLQDEIFLLFTQNIKLLQIVRKITINYFNKRRKTIPLNSNSILLEPTFLIKEKDFIDIPFRKGVFRFNKYEIVSLFDSAVFHVNHKFSTPKYPTNPYTNVPFNIKDFYCIYEQIKKKFTSIPLSFVLLNLCYYDINILESKHSYKLQEIALLKHINSLSDYDFYRKIYKFLDYLQITTCKKCLVKIPEIRTKLTPMLLKYYLKKSFNSERLHTRFNQELINNFKQIIPHIFNIDKEQHLQSVHRVKKKYKTQNKGFRFKGVTPFTPSSINKNEIFVFKSSISDRSIQMKKERKKIQWKREQRRRERLKIKIPIQSKTRLTLRNLARSILHISLQDINNVIIENNTIENNIDILNNIPVLDNLENEYTIETEYMIFHNNS